MQLIVNLWNSLLQEVVEAKSRAKFNKGVDKFPDDRSVTAY